LWIFYTNWSWTNWSYFQQTTYRRFINRSFCHHVFILGYLILVLGGGVEKLVFKLIIFILTRCFSFFYHLLLIEAIYEHTDECGLVIFPYHWRVQNVFLGEGASYRWYVFLAPVKLDVTYSCFRFSKLYLNMWGNIKSYLTNINTLTQWINSTVSAMSIFVLFFALSPYLNFSLELYFAPLNDPHLSFLTIWDLIFDKCL